ncbi:diphosphomevalonate decarboxylase [Nocardia otitidiscaviarum]|uniref:diphosphomevalonate decarboxylase n=1 Tax=Nocardia otitidiscaviarum TaxID=1823 RepID=UPI0024566934|nr:diphosphomevalonate decarboxylase [Nocardia otitidiscaviarum]
MTPRAHATGPSEAVTCHQHHAATAIAYPNIALIKYWGKRDERMVLPVCDSLSMTLSVFPTTTTVTLAPALSTDIVWMNGCPAPAPVAARVSAFLTSVRALSSSAVPASVETTNSVPTGAGLASSASGFAALTVAAARAYGLRADRTELSRLARRGSGSAARSVFGEFVQWHAGTGTGAAGDRSSYAEQLDASALDPAMVVTIVDARAKPTSSREAMRHTVVTSPLYLPWARSCADDIARMRLAISEGDLPRVGEIAEHNAFGMHATMWTARPPIRFLAPESLMIIDRIAALREQGIAAYATIDAGPNVVALCGRRDAERVAADLRTATRGIEVHIAVPGPAATVTDGRDR